MSSAWSLCIYPSVDTLLLSHPWSLTPRVSLRCVHTQSGLFELEVQKLRSGPRTVPLGEPTPNYAPATPNSLPQLRPTLNVTFRPIQRVYHATADSATSRSSAIVLWTMPECACDESAAGGLLLVIAEQPKSCSSAKSRAQGDTAWRRIRVPPSKTHTPRLCGTASTRERATSSVWWASKPKPL